MRSSLQNILRRSFIFLLLFYASSISLAQDTLVHAQMFIKGQIGEEGYTTITAEGKTYAIKAVTEQTFGPNDKSFNLMHHHGVAFESEIMAYRLYFDKRQTVDIYAKKTPRLELAECLWYPNDSLLAEGYGDDVLKVGNEIGVGTPRFYKDGQFLKMDKFSTRTQRIVKQTPDSVVVEMEVLDLLLTGEAEPLNMLVRYTLLAHRRDPLCEVWLSRIPEKSTLVTGVMKVGNNSKTNIQLSTSAQASIQLSSWGTDWPVNDTVKYPKETVGLAVCIPQQYAGAIFASPKNLFCELQLQEENRSPMFPKSPIYADYSCYATFHLTCVSLKENNPPAHNAKQFFRFTKKWANSLCKVSLILPSGAAI